MLTWSASFPMAPCHVSQCWFERVRFFAGRWEAMRNKPKESQFYNRVRDMVILGSVLPCSGGCPLFPWASCFPLRDCNRLPLAQDVGFAQIGWADGRVQYDQSGRGKYQKGESGRERHVENSTTKSCFFLPWTPELVDLCPVQFIQAPWQSFSRA